MNLKTSYFNLPLFKSNLKRFWWMGGAVLLGFLTVALLILFDDNSTDGYTIMNVLLIAVAGVMPAIFFSYLNSPGPVTCLHALPVKRKAHFITNIVTVYTLILVPAIIAYGIGFLYCILKEPIHTVDLAENLMALLVCITIAMSAGTLGSMITGNTIAAIAFAGLLFACPFYGEGVLKGFLSANLYGMWDVTYYSMENMSVLDVNPFMLGWFVVAVAGLIVAWFLYKNRRLEANGDIIAFKFLKPLFIACVSLFSGLIGYFYLGIFFGDSIFLMLPFGILGAVVSYMLAKKAFTLKGIWKPVLIYALFVGVVWAGITFDLTGFERRVPDIDDIESIDMVNVDEFDGMRNYQIIEGEKYYYKASLEDYRYYDKKDFENITRLHADRIENRTTDVEKIYISYNLKNGRNLRRVYYASLIDDRELLEPIYCTEQKLKLNHNWLVNKYPVTEISITDDRVRNSSNTFEILVGDSEKAKLLLDALDKDIREASYEDIVSSSNSMTRIQLVYQRELINKDGKVIFDDINNHPEHDNFGIPENYERTTALLREWGLYDAIYKPEEVSYVELEFNYISGERIRITDPQKIKEIYDFVSQSKYMYKDNDMKGRVYSIRAYFCDREGKNIFDSGELTSSHLPLPGVIVNATENVGKAYGGDYLDEPNVIVETADSF